jgi:hypothetical protein
MMNLQFRPGASSPSIHQPHSLTKIATSLNLDQLQQKLAGIFQPVGSFCERWRTAKAP